MKEVDLSASSRGKQYEYFCSLPSPHVALTAQCDITKLMEKVRKNGWPFFLTLLYCAVNAANAVPELRRRIREQQVVEFERCLSSHTVALPDGSYCYCELDCHGPFADFLPYARRQVELAKEKNSLDDGGDADRLFFVTCLPWLSFTAIQLPTAGAQDSNPRLTFGKYEPQGDRLLLPVSLMVHHGLVDGIHIARFFAEFDKQMEAL